MEKSGQRPTHSRIIDKHELKSPFRYIMEGAITLALWTLWLYWILPILTLLLWLLGLEFILYIIIPEITFMEIVSVLRNGGLVIISIFMLNIIWISYNYFIIFRLKGDRRKNVKPYHPHTIEKFFQIDPKVQKQFYEKHIIYIEVNNTVIKSKEETTSKPNAKDEHAA
ncbi:MAG: poly-beta-1,6-N-acetyl-D-glucosamine biosynthesis protein PgaD [bacterium]